jgi:hypothetical protein
MTAAPIRSQLFAIACVSALLGAAATFGAESQTPITFGRCEYQMDRYIVCARADPRIESHLKANAGRPADLAFAGFMEQELRDAGCAIDGKPVPAYVNGIFFSLDARFLQSLICGSTQPRLQFQPGRMTFLDRFIFGIED